MLNEKAIDDLIQPIVERQESINTYVLQEIARKIRDIGSLSSYDINRMKILVDYGTDIREMNKEIARLSGLQVRDVKKLLKTVAIDTHTDAKSLYDYRHRSFIPYNKNAKLQKIVNAVSRRTNETFVNLSKSKATGFMIRDLKNPRKLKFQTIDKAYKSVIDEAIQASKSGVIDYRTAMRRTIKQLSDSGIRRITWESGYTQRLDTVVRRNLLEGIRALNQEIEDMIGEEIGADGKELSVHANCALDHEPFQGHQFTNEEFERLQTNQSFKDVNGQTFLAVERVIGQYNCRHIARSIIVGVTEPKYTLKELDRFIQKNHAGYTLPNGKHLTMYECTQMQRQLETRIRYAKDEQMTFQEAGDIERAKLARQKVLRLTDEYKRFSKACGLRVQNDRASVAGYRAIKS